MKKKNIIVLIVALLIVVIGAFSYYYFFSSNSPVAVLHITGGVVEVNKGNGWESAVDGMRLGLKDKVRTLQNGKAILMIYDSIIVNLQQNTEVFIKSLAKSMVTLQQNKGVTWDKFSRLMGVEGVRIETPTTVATVRGTFFKISEDELLVKEGVVNLKSGGQEFNVGKDHKLKREEGSFREFALDAEDEAEAKEALKEQLEYLKNERNAELRRVMKKYKAIVSTLQKRYNVTEDDVWIFIGEVDNNEYDIDELLKDSPIQLKPLKRVIVLTREIQELQSKLQE